jgi:hypothetical protein
MYNWVQRSEMCKIALLLASIGALHAQNYSGVWCAVSGAQDCIVLQQTGEVLRATFQIQGESVGEGTGWARGAALALAIRRLDSGLVAGFAATFDRSERLTGTTLNPNGTVRSSGTYARTGSGPSVTSGGVRLSPQLGIGGYWIVLDDSGNCRSSITIQQAATGEVTGLSGTTSCENGRVAGAQAGAEFTWVNGTTLRYKYRFTSKNSPQLNDGSAEIVFESTQNGRLSARDTKGNTGSNQIRRGTSATPVATPRPAYPSVQGGWVVIDDSGNCRSTLTFQQNSEGMITGFIGKTSCEGGRVTGTQSGSGFTWVDSNTLRYDYRFTSKNSANLNDGSAEIVFQSESTGRLNARDNRGNSGANQIRRQ